MKGDGEGAGGGAIVPLLMGGFDDCRDIGWGIAGAVAAVGVACGVDAAELALPIEIGVGVCLDTAAGG